MIPAQAGILAPCLPPLEPTKTMTKVEMLAHRDEYHALLKQANASITEGFCARGVELAVSAWDHIDGITQYERKFEKATEFRFEAIQIVLRYAPLLFDYSSLKKLDDLVRDQKRLERDSRDDLATALEEARKLMFDASRLWDSLEPQPQTVMSELSSLLGGSPERWQTLINGWAESGLVRHWQENGTTRLALVSRMTDVVRAKCPSCGVVAKAAKLRFLDTQRCPKCGRDVSFVMIGTAVAASPQD